MRSFSSLVHDALFPSTRVYHDENGNYRGTSTDITPWMLLLGRIWGILLWLYIILMPLLAPVYFVFAHWFCRKYDAEFTKEDPKGWPSEKKEILKKHIRSREGKSGYYGMRSKASWKIDNAEP